MTADPNVVLVCGRDGWFPYHKDDHSIIRQLPKRSSPISRMTLDCIKNLVFHTWEQQRLEISKDSKINCFLFPDHLVVLAKRLVMVYCDSEGTCHSFGDLVTSSPWSLVDMVAFFCRQAAIEFVYSRRSWPFR